MYRLGHTYTKTIRFIQAAREVDLFLATWLPAELHAGENPLDLMTMKFTN